MKPYVLITGASGGLGKAFAFAYAKKGMNLVLTDLPNPGLGVLSNFLRLNYGVKIYDKEIDLSLIDNCNQLYKEVKEHGISISYLINNAGVLSQGFFEEVTKRYIETQIEVNVMVPTLLSKLFLDDLKLHKPSGILNVCSMASFFNLPTKQVYGATKAYLLSFSKSLSLELEPYGITVSAMCPGGLNTTTQMCLHNSRLPWLSKQSILDPEIAVDIAIKAFQKGKKVIIPGKVNKLLHLIDGLLPGILKRLLMLKTMNSFNTKSKFSYA